MQDMYGLSLGQANYIAISSTQGGIGGCYPSHIIHKINPEISCLINRPSCLSKIVIHKDKSVEYIGGQVILFDILQDNNISQLLAQHCGIENHLMMLNNDKIVLYVSVNLGKLGQTFTRHPEVHIHVAGTGMCGQKFLAEFHKLRLNVQNCKIFYMKILY